jgi:cation diffusion facilitator CzcD-associated flavoprotein CzcO
MSRADAPVVIVGAGAAGLAAAASLQRRGLRPVVLERDDEVGAVWARRYDRLSLHTVRRFSGLPYRPLPREYPRYVPKDLYARYLRDYAEALGLDVRLGQTVERIRREGDAWVVSTGDGEWRARTVVVATGRHGAPRLPQWPGADDYAGELLHSADYRTASAFAGRRVLVVGIGNSGAEIAADLVEAGAGHVAVAVRTPPPITSRELFGVPVQLLGILLMPFPAALVDRFGAALRRVANGDLRRYGLEREAWGPFSARRPPLIDVGFLRRLKEGRILVRPAVSRLTASGAVFADGREEPFDAIVAATGFTTGLAELLGESDALDERGYPDGSGRPAGLFFIGYDETPRGALFETKRAAQRLAIGVERYLGEAP